MALVITPFAYKALKAVIERGYRLRGKFRDIELGVEPSSDPA